MIPYFIYNIFLRNNAWGRRRHKGTDVNAHKYSYGCSSSKLNNIDKKLIYNRWR